MFILLYNNILMIIEKKEGKIVTYYVDKESPNTYEDIDTTIKDILANKIKKKHLINYLKHSYKIYKS